MEYIEARPSIKSGDLLAFSGGDWKSIHGIKVNIVRMFTKSKYSHVGLAWVVGGRVFCLEAVKPKVRIHPLSKLGNFDLLALGANWKPETEEFALASVGVNYSELEAIKAFFLPLEQGNVKQCAAYVREVLIKDGIKLGFFSRPDTVVEAALDRNVSILKIRNTYG